MGNNSLRIGTLAMVFALVSLRAFGQSSDSDARLLSRAGNLVNLAYSIMETQGIRFPKPAVKLANAPGGEYQVDSNEILVAPFRFADQGYLKLVAPTTEGGFQFHSLVSNWYGVFHEFGHSVQLNMGIAQHLGSPFWIEADANDIAVAIIAQTPTGKQKLTTLRQVLTEGLTRLGYHPNSGSSAESYFESHYQDIVSSRVKYMYFQSLMILRAIDMTTSKSLSTICLHIGDGPAAYASWAKSLPLHLRTYDPVHN